MSIPGYSMGSDDDSDDVSMAQMTSPPILLVENVSTGEKFCLPLLSFNYNKTSVAVNFECNFEGETHSQLIWETWLGSEGDVDDLKLDD